MGVPLNITTGDNFTADLQPTKWLGVYIGDYGTFGVIQATAVVILTLSLLFTTLSASKIMHNQMLLQVLRSPLSFFETTPIGRKLSNRIFILLVKLIPVQVSILTYVIFLFV